MKTLARILLVLALPAVPAVPAAAQDAAPTEPTPHEQYLVELINRARADPLAEADRYGIELNEGLEPGTISPEPKQPLAVNPRLVASARGHSRWMARTGTFSHAGAGGSGPGDRMAAAGYTFERPWRRAENIGWYGTTAEVTRTELVERIHETLFVDEGYRGRGHRVDMLMPQFREVGTGLAVGEYQDIPGAMATEDFASSGQGRFLTGVVYRDEVTADDFYTPGEGLGGVTVTATAEDGQAWETTTWRSGGYTLALPPGTYDVTAAGGPLEAPLARRGVRVQRRNVKVDFVPRADATR